MGLVRLTAGLFIYSTSVSKPIAIELHVLLYPNITHRYQQNMHNIAREARQR